MSEAEQQIVDSERQKDLQRLRGFRPIDDDFMRGLFKGNMPLAEMVLRIIMQKPDLQLLDIDTQADMKRVTGARSVCLDVYATDSENKKYDVEIQRADLGAGEHRARYNSSVMDVENLHSGQDFTELPDTYTIFITEKDFFGAGKAAYPISSMNWAIEEPFKDGRYLLYVNGEYRGDDEIGKLMHDFNCTDADDMNYPLLAERTRYLKENPKGVEEMCKAMQDMRDEAAMKKSINIAEKLIEMRIATLEQIAAATELPIEKIRELAKIKTA